MRPLGILVLYWRWWDQKFYSNLDHDVKRTNSTWSKWSVAGGGSKDVWLTKHKFWCVCLSRTINTQTFQPTLRVAKLQSSFPFSTQAEWPTCAKSTPRYPLSLLFLSSSKTPPPWESNIWATVCWGRDKVEQARWIVRDAGPPMKGAKTDAVQVFHRPCQDDDWTETLDGYFASTRHFHCSPSRQNPNVLYPSLLICK